MGSRSSPAPAEITESGNIGNARRKEKRSVDLTYTKTTLHRFDVRPIEAQKTLQTLNHRLAADITNGVADVSAQCGSDGARENNLAYDRGEGLQEREFGADEQKAGAHYNQRRGYRDNDTLDDKNTPRALGADRVYDPIENFSQCSFPPAKSSAEDSSSGCRT